MSRIRDMTDDALAVRARLVAGGLASAYDRETFEELVARFESATSRARREDAVQAFDRANPGENGS